MLFVQLVWLPILTVVTLFMWDCSSIGQCNAFARRKLRVQAPSIPTRPMIGLWVKCSRSHPLFIMFFFLLFFLFYITSLNCILILLDNVFGLFEIFFYLFIFPFIFSHRLAWFLVLDFVPRFELWKSCMWQFVVKKSLKVVLLNHWYGKKNSSLMPLYFKQFVL